MKGGGRSNEWGSESRDSLPSLPQFEELIRFQTSLGRDLPLVNMTSVTHLLFKALALTRQALDLNIKASD